jgi:hypothetical protein
MIIGNEFPELLPSTTRRLTWGNSISIKLTENGSANVKSAWNTYRWNIISAREIPLSAMSVEQNMFSHPKTL